MQTLKQMRLNLRQGPMKQPFEAKAWFTKDQRFDYFFCVLYCYATPQVNAFKFKARTNLTAF